MSCPAKTTIAQRKETFTVRGEDISTVSNVRIDARTGEEIFDMELDDVNMKRVYAQYARRRCHPTSMEITRLRRQYGLSRSCLSRMLGLGEDSLRRYENGALMTEDHAVLIAQCRDPQFVTRLLLQNEIR